jgi:hypothetical protein
MVASHTALPGAGILLCLCMGTGPGRAEPARVEEARTVSPPKLYRAVTKRGLSLRPTPFGQGRLSALERQAQRRREIEALRLQRKTELEAARSR